MKLLVLGLAVWRVSYFLVHEDGPGKVGQRIRKASGIEYSADGEIWAYNDYTPLTCVFCTSMWVAAVLMFLPGGIHRWLAASAIAVLVEKEYGGG